MIESSRVTGAEILDTEDAFFTALLDRDQARLDSVLTDDFMIVGVVDGAVATKRELLGALEFLVFESIDHARDAAVVRQYHDAAVVVGETRMRFGVPGLPGFDGPSRYTHVYVRTDSRWRLASAQGTPIRTLSESGS
jgi:hypothetical protein